MQHHPVACKQPVISPTVSSSSAPPAAPHKTEQGAFCIWHGLNFGNWLRLLAMRPRWEWRSLPRMASISALSLVNSADEVLEKLLYGRQVSRVEIKEPPVFILGHWRSGTTLLHNLFTLDPQFSYPNLYHVLNSGHFLTTEWLVSRLTGWLLPATRPMDNLPAAWSMTQEDEIALLLATGVSPYWFIIFSGDRSRYGRFFDLQDATPQELKRWKEFMRLFLKKLTYKFQKPIVLKSPSHTYRIPLLLEMFPNAKFVYIYRDPYAVMTSSLHLRRTMFTENGFAPPDFDDIEGDTLLTYENCIKTYEATKHLVPAGQLHELRYENLEADPLGEMRNLYQGLNLAGWDRMETALQKEVPALSRYQKNKFSIDEGLQQRIYERCRWVFELYGYPSPVDESPPVPRPLSATH
jgi:omega-hydroxy-beta-dihydromenaquinone-9 sulfotransferase